MHDPAAGYSVPLWPLALYFAIVVLTGVGIVVASYFLGGRHRERATNVPYESGMAPTTSARLRFAADFYLVAVFFVIFDLESAFLYAWAVSVRQAGWTGLVEATFFIIVLLAALIYLWALGALDWRTVRQRLERAKLGEGPS